VYEDKPPQNFLAVQYRHGGAELEVYGESVANAAFSNLFDVPSEAMANRTLSLALAELRLAPETECTPFERALPPPSEARVEISLDTFAIPYAAALQSAVARYGLDINLLPEGKRKKDSKLVYVPTAILGTILTGLLLAIVFYDKIEERRYMASIETEIAAVRPDAIRADEFEKTAANARTRIELLDKYRKRAPQDLDVLHELTRILAPPVWVSSLDVNRGNVFVAGEADSATPLLKAIDESPLFVNSDFTMPLGRTASGELFRLRTDREPGK
jgi:Tfp pilus assembly protein PilN